ncbi:jupiter microtubule associated homolog 2 isoform X2 [Thalassophryne amazonica]|nr:jupiter microtubule associated homolog 2 isoform X2 [Thalassophryne amazonica]
MTSTNMFQGLDNSAKPSSRVLQPPGGGCSNLFGCEEDAAPSRRPNKMSSTVFAPPAESQNIPRRSNPPGGKTSGIFEPEPPAQPKKPIPPGGLSSNIFGSVESVPAQSPTRSHPNKPKDNLSVGPEPESPAPEHKVSEPVVKEETVSPKALPPKEEPAAVSSCPEPKPSPSPFPDANALKNHEPHLGPRPRSHNKVLNPPGGKSSVVFY